ncbi:hypothetical protein [Sphingopyxis lindanitolerans]|uniref:hypothetical protein n=1 Tax=Sphingopyxis lindanitolerans TaxID=2054227 RepID=UPI0011B2820A|nr:hypothetical protein [Sphingopyxis lindanitolerans]
MKVLVLLGTLICLPAVAEARVAQNSPKAVISYLRDAYDAKNWDAIIRTWWPDGTIVGDKPDGRGKETRSFKEVPTAGLGIQYDSTLIFRSTEVSRNRAIIVTFEKSKAQYLGFDGGYENAGPYSVNEFRYVCERRNGQWRVLIRETLSSRHFGSDVEWKKAQDVKRQEIERKKQ